MNAQTTTARTFKDATGNRYTVPATFPTMQEANEMRARPSIFAGIMDTYESILLCGAFGLNTTERNAIWEGAEEEHLQKDAHGLAWQDRLSFELDQKAEEIAQTAAGILKVSDAARMVYPCTPELMNALRNAYKGAGPFEYAPRALYASLHKEACIARRGNVSPSVWASRMSPDGQLPTGLLALIAIRVYSMEVSELLKVYR